MGKLGIAQRSLGPHMDLGCRVLMQLELQGLRNLLGQGVLGCGLWTSTRGPASPPNKSPSCHIQTVTATQVAVPMRECPHLLGSKAGEPEPVARGPRPGPASQTPASWGQLVALAFLQLSGERTTLALAPYRNSCS